MCTLILVAILAWSARAAAGGFQICITNELSGDVSVIDGETRKVTSTVAVGKRPRGIHASPDGRFVYVALSGSPNAGPPSKAGNQDKPLPPADRTADGIGVIDMGTRKLIHVLPSGIDPEQFDISADGSTLYIANEDAAQVTALDLKSRSVVKTIAVKDEPEGVQVTPDGRHVYVTCETAGDIFVFDTAKNDVVSHFVVPGRPRSVAFSPNVSKAYVPSETLGTITVIETARFSVVKKIQLPDGARPMGTLMSADGKHLYVSGGRGGHVYTIDCATNEVAGNVKVGTRAWGMAASPDGKFLYVANGPSNDISVVDTTDMTELERVKCGQSPWGVAIIPNAAPAPAKLP